MSAPPNITTPSIYNLQIETTTLNDINKLEVDNEPPLKNAKIREQPTIANSNITNTLITNKS